jgi:predicted ester cyclase
MDDIPRRDFLGYSTAAAISLIGPVGYGFDVEAAPQDERPPMTMQTSTETNKRLAREYYLVLDKDGPDAGGDYVAPNFQYYGANHTGFDGLTPDERGRAFYKAFPDFTHVILEQIAEGDIVVERIRYFATHMDTFMGIPGTGRKITFTGIDWVRFENGKAVERWGVADELDLRRQLLGLPDPHLTQTNKALAREYYEVIDQYGPMSGGAFSAPHSHYYGANHTGFVDTYPGSRGVAFYTAFPDFTHVILEQVAEGDYVVERIRYYATHKGPFMNIPATGRRITFTGIDWVRFVDGRSVERWGVADELDVRRQLLGEPDPRPAGGNGTL